MAKTTALAGLYVVQTLNDGIAQEGLTMLECVACGGPLMLLGQMGKLVHFRCRNCGMDQSKPATDLPPDFFEDGDEDEDGPDCAGGGGCAAGDGAEAESPYCIDHDRGVGFFIAGPDGWREGPYNDRPSAEGAKRDLDEGRRRWRE